MDILSSKLTLLDTKLIEAFAVFGKAIMMMTAAGTVPAAKVLVVGAGVAGLQQLQQQKEWVQLFLQQMLDQHLKNKLKV